MSGHMAGRGAYPVLIAQLCAVLASGCLAATRQSTSTWADDDDTPATGRVTPRRSSSTLTRADLQSARFVSAFDAVAKLRPEFLRGSNRIQPVSPAGPVAVYLNNIYSGDITTLETIPIDVIREIAFVHPVEAQVRFGPFCRCANGALLVTTRRVDGR